MRKEHYAPIFEQCPKRINSYIELFGGSGILITDAVNVGLSCTYNDDDKNKQNFFKCIKEKPSDLRMKCIYYLDNPDARITSKSPSLDRAGFFWADICRKNLSKSKSKKTTQEKMMTALEPTWQFEQASKIYETVTFKKRNALSYAETCRYNENLLVIVDPPYLYTKDYSSRDTDNKKSFEFEDWKKLAKTFSNAKCIWIIHCRLTAPKNFCKKREEQNSEDDTYIRCKIEQLFKNNRFYYKEIPYGGLGTIECMISNYHFKSFHPFSN